MRGGGIETEPYRLTADVETDVARVRGLLDRAWKRLLAELDFRDPRRSLAAARLQSLRATYALT